MQTKRASINETARSAPDALPRTDRAVARTLSRAGASLKLVLPPTELGGATGYVQLFQSNGQISAPRSKGSPLPVTAATRAVAAGRRDAFFSDANVAGTPVRVLTERAAEGGVWQVALPLSDIDNTLTHLKLVLALVCWAGSRSRPRSGCSSRGRRSCPYGA